MNVPSEQWTGAKGVRLAVEKFADTSDRQAKSMIRLTWAIAVLTIFLVVGLGIQLWLAWITLDATGVIIH